MEEKFAQVDITPKQMGGTGKNGLKTTVFQEVELNHIKNNPSGLTKEGIQKKIALWKKSSNSHVLLKYKAMLNHCTNVAKSGKTSEGHVILARD